MLVEIASAVEFLKEHESLEVGDHTLDWELICGHPWSFVAKNYRLVFVSDSRCRCGGEDVGQFLQRY